MVYKTRLLRLIMISSLYKVIFIVFFTELVGLVTGDCTNCELQKYAFCSSSENAEDVTVSCLVAGITLITTITSFTLDQQTRQKRAFPTTLTDSLGRTVCGYGIDAMQFSDCAFS